MKRKLISFRPRSGSMGRWSSGLRPRGCYFKVHMEQENGMTLFARKKLLSWILVRNAWPGAGLFRASDDDDEGWELVNDVSQRMLDHVLERLGWPFPPTSAPGLRW